MEAPVAVTCVRHDVGARNGRMRAAVEKDSMHVVVGKGNVAGYFLEKLC
jgi:hypothetical protein